MNANPEHHAKRKPSQFWAFAPILVLLACGVLAVFGLLYAMHVHPTPAAQTAEIRARNPAFNLENTTPQADAQVLEATQEALVQGYGWVDRNANIARIPIDRAMELLAQSTPEVTPTVQP